MLPLIIRPEARDEMREARKWYDRQCEGLGEQFLDAVDELFDQIRTDPTLYAPAVKNVRQGKLRRFPYVVYYRALENSTEVFAVLHGRRDPRIWQRRV